MKRVALLYAMFGLAGCWSSNAVFDCERTNSCTSAPNRLDGGGAPADGGGAAEDGGVVLADGGAVTSPVDACGTTFMAAFEHGVVRARVNGSLLRDRGNYSDSGSVSGAFLDLLLDRDVNGAVVMGQVADGAFPVCVALGDRTVTTSLAQYLPQGGTFTTDASDTGRAAILGVEQGMLKGVFQFQARDTQGGGAIQITEGAFWVPPMPGQDGGFVAADGGMEAQDGGAVQDGGAASDGGLDIPSTGVAVQLVWDKNMTDMDIHLLKGGAGFGTGGWFDLVNDCYYRDCAGQGLDWGVQGDNSDNPRLVLDNTTGFGPELIDFTAPPAGTYRAGVHYYCDNSVGASTATVRIYCDGVLASELSKGLSGTGQFWEVANVTWPGCVIEPLGNTMAVSEGCLGLGF
jgi:hypothetical protein